MSRSRRRFSLAVCGCVLGSMVPRTLGAQSPSGAGLLTPGYRPAAGSDELGLWQAMDSAERDMRTSRFLIRNSDAISYLMDIECRLAPDYCPDVRTYIVRTASFNASMAPNGMMQVWTGLLLRCRNEAQLAAVLAHETGHYLKRHSLARFRDVRDKAALGSFLTIGLAFAGLGLVGTFAQIGLAASTLAFSRDQEREADELSVSLLARAGYPPIAAAQVWGQFLEEMKRSTAEKDGSIFFATHPSIEERLETLRQQGEAAGGQQGDFGRARYQQRIGPLLPLLFSDELKLRQYGRTEVIIDAWLVERPEDARIHYAKGELHRLRRAPGDAERAIATYARALELPDPPVDAWRGLGLAFLDAGDPPRARSSFETYLKLAPPTADLETVRSLLKEIPE